jgi:hypothetical protein
MNEANQEIIGLFQRLRISGTLSKEEFMINEIMLQLLARFPMKKKFSDSEEWLIRQLADALFSAL